MPRLFLALILFACSHVSAFSQDQATGIEQVRQLITQGKHPEAEKLAKELLAKAPADAEVQFQLGRAIYFQDRFREAIPLFEQVSKALPNFAGAHKYIGDSQFGLGEFKLASEAFLRAIELEPKDPEYHTDLGRSLARLGSGQAEGAFRQALSLEPEFLPALYEYASYLSLGKRYREAGLQLNKALAVDDKSAYGWSVIGDVQFKMKSYDRAEEAYNKALLIDPKRVRALDGLSKLLMTRELWKDAENATRALVDADPATLSHYLRMANIIDEQARYADSEAIYQKLIKDHPTYADVFVDYGVSLWRQKKDKEAEAQFKAGIAVNSKNPWFHLTYGNFLRQMKRLKEAKASYEEALRLDPNYEEARNRLDMVKLEIG